MATEKKSTHVLLDRSDFDDIALVAKAEGMDRSSFVRRLIRDHLAIPGVLAKAKAKLLAMADR